MNRQFEKSIIYFQGQVAQAVQPAQVLATPTKVTQAQQAAVVQTQQQQSQAQVSGKFALYCRLFHNFSRIFTTLLPATFIEMVHYL